MSFYPILDEQASVVVYSSFTFKFERRNNQSVARFRRGAYEAIQD